MLYHRIFLFNEIHCGGPCSPKFKVKQIKPGAGAVGTSLALNQLLKQSLGSHFQRDGGKKPFPTKDFLQELDSASSGIHWPSKGLSYPKKVWRTISAWRRKPIFRSFLIEIPGGKHPTSCFGKFLIHGQSASSATRM